MKEPSPQNENVRKKDFDEATKRIDLLLTGVVVVLFLGFASLLITAISPIIDAWRFRTSTYQSLINEVSEQSAKIEELTEEIEGLQSLQAQSPQRPTTQEAR